MPANDAGRLRGGGAREGQPDVLGQADGVESGGGEQIDFVALVNDACVTGGECVLVGQPGAP